MASHITPLSRGQLQELEQLIQHILEGSLGARSLSTTALSLLATSPLSASSCGGRAAGGEARPTQDDHPLSRGLFTDVFSDELTRDAWSLQEKLTYLVWWSHRPGSCGECGMSDCWVACCDDEMKCGHCGAAAGSTSMNDVVEDLPALDDDGDRDDDDDDGDPVHGSSENADALSLRGLVEGAGMWSGGLSPKRGAGGCHPADPRKAESAPVTRTGNVLVSVSSSSAVAMYLFFYQWLEHIPVSGCAGRAPGSARDPSDRDIALPSKQDLPAVLRAAYDVSLLLTLPSMTLPAICITRSSALYLSLILHRFPVPFPLFSLGVRFLRSGAASDPEGPPECGGATSVASCSITWPLRGFVEEDDVLTDEEVQWEDVQQMALVMGITLSDFFEKATVAAQYLQNVMTVARAFAVPSVLWRLERRSGRAAYIQSLQRHRKPSGVASALGQSLPSAPSMSPDLTAMIVALELARQFDAEPQPDDDRERVGQWLDRLGLYPQRTCYRARHQAPLPKDESKKRERPLKGLVDTDSQLKAPKSEPGGDECHDAVRRRRTESSVAAEDLCAPAVADSRVWLPPLVTPGLVLASALPGDLSVRAVLPSPCANALLHVFAAIFAIRPLQLAEMAERSGLYRGKTQFHSLLEEAARSGAYWEMPLCRRLSPAQSPWSCAYSILHSPDRLPFLAALRHLAHAKTRDKETPAVRLVQRFVRRHGGALKYQFHYAIRVCDDDEKQLQGAYFASFVSKRVAVYTCAHSARRTLAFDRDTGQIFVSYLGVRERQLRELRSLFVGPIVVHVESIAAKGVMDCARTGLNSAEWRLVVRHLDRCGRVRRRMRVPMLASRLDALASIRELGAPSDSGFIAAATTLRGWGSTESLLTDPGVIAEDSLKEELLANWLAIPEASFLHGLSENRVVGLYTGLHALLEHKEKEDRKELLDGLVRILLVDGGPLPAAAAAGAQGTDPSSVVSGNNNTAAGRVRHLHRVLALCPPSIGNAQDPWPDYLLDLEPLATKYPRAVRRALAALHVAMYGEDGSREGAGLVQRRVRGPRREPARAGGEGDWGTVARGTSPDMSSRSSNSSSCSTGAGVRGEKCDGDLAGTRRLHSVKKSPAPAARAQQTAGGELAGEQRPPPVGCCVVDEFTQHLQLYVRVFSLLSPPSLRIVATEGEADAASPNSHSQSHHHARAASRGITDSADRARNRLSPNGSDGSSRSRGLAAGRAYRRKGGMCGPPDPFSETVCARGGSDDARSDISERQTGLDGLDASVSPCAAGTGAYLYYPLARFGWCAPGHFPVMLMPLRTPGGGGGAAVRAAHHPPLPAVSAGGRSVFHPFFFVDSPGQNEYVTPSIRELLRAPQRSRPSADENVLLLTTNVATLYQCIAREVTPSSSGRIDDTRDEVRGVRESALAASGEEMATHARSSPHKKPRLRSRSLGSAGGGERLRQRDGADVVMAKHHHGSGTVAPHMRHGGAVNEPATLAAGTTVAGCDGAADWFLAPCGIASAQTCRNRLIRVHRFLESYQAERARVEPGLAALERVIASGLGHAE